MAMAGRRGTSGCVNMACLLVLAVGAVVIGGNTVTVHGAEAAGGHLPLMAARSCATSLASAGEDAAPGVAPREEISSSMRAIFLAVSSERVLLLATRLSSTAFSLVAARAKASIPEVNGSSKDGEVGERKAPPANPEAEGLGRWYPIAAEAEPKVSPGLPEAHCSRSMVSWVSLAHCFHAGQVLVAGSWASHTTGWVMN
jgi:hypothetical protein